MHKIKICFIGAGSTIFTKNIIGDILNKQALDRVHFNLMDIDAKRLEESSFVVKKLIQSKNSKATYTTFTNQKEALKDVDFIIVSFQIGGYKPCTITDFEICKKYGLNHTIADTLGIGGIMRGLRSIPHLWKICEDMLEVCPDAWMLNYVNPMAMNTWAMYEKYPQIKQVGLCHSVQGTIEEIANDLQMDYTNIRFTCAGINHMAFYINLEEKLSNGKYQNLYPKLINAYNNKLVPRENIHGLDRCNNIIRYEILKKFNYFVTESSEHFAEYTPYFIKPNRDDLIKKYQIPLDEYPKRCEEQIATWNDTITQYKQAKSIEVKDSREYASLIINSIVTGEPSVIYANVKNTNLIDNLIKNCCVEVACVADENGITPTKVNNLPTHLAALMRTNINVQELLVQAVLNQDKSSIYYAGMLDPLTSSTLEPDEIYALIDEIIKAHGNWLPKWVH